MRRIGLVIVIVAALAVAYGIGRYQASSRTGAKAGRRILYYVDPMHPSYKSDKPGTAPDCGMRLEPVYSDDAGAAQSPVQLPAGAVSIDRAMQRMVGIRLATVEKAGATRQVRVAGRVEPEDTRVYRINSGVDGFVRETFNDSVGVRVKKDQKLATYYAPDFSAAASGFLAAVERVPGAVGKDGARFTPNFPGAIAKEGARSIQGYTDRLKNLGMSAVQIDQVAYSRQLPDSIEVLAPADGFILARNISPGQHFDRSIEFYRIADLSKVWVIAEVSEQDSPYLRPGAAAQIKLAGEGRRLPARVADSLPQSEPGGGTVKLRLEADNPEFLLRPDMLVDVELPVRIAPAVTVPLDALVDSGSRARVYVEHGDGVFEPREVQTGWRFGERAEILSGVRPGERVVAGATFLVDSESRLKAPDSAPPAAGTMQETAAAPVRTVAAKTVKDPSCGMQVDPEKAAAAGNTLTYKGTTYYFCSRQCKEAFQNNPIVSARKTQGHVDD